MDSLVSALHDAEPSFNDVAAKAGVEIIVRHDGLVTWINIDGICRMRIIANGITVPITIEDQRNAK